MLRLVGLYATAEVVSVIPSETVIVYSYPSKLICLITRDHYSAEAYV